MIVTINLHLVTLFKHFVSFIFILLREIMFKTLPAKNYLYNFAGNYL